jgi:hypothetical protein
LCSGSTYRVERETFVRDGAQDSEGRIALAPSGDTNS